MEGFVDHRDSSGNSIIIYREAKVVVTRAIDVRR
jgi:hypothetical protein